MEKDIGKIKKNDQTDILLRVDDFGGRRGLTIREFVSSDKYTGFTKAGTRIPAPEFTAFKKMINSIDEKEMMEEPEQSEQTGEKKTFTPKKTFKPKAQEELPDY